LVSRPGGHGTGAARERAALPAQIEELRLSDAPPLRIVPSASRGDVLEPHQVAPGWGVAKRKMTGAGHARSELARVYRKASAGEITVEDLAKITYALERFSKVAELADAEQRIEALERRVEELARNGR
jgi:hypothetical protein